jgi:hypothetical protein
MTSVVRAQGLGSLAVDTLSTLADLASALLSAVAIVLAVLVARLATRQADEMHARERYDAYLALTTEILARASYVQTVVSPYWRERAGVPSSDELAQARAAEATDAVAVLTRAVERLGLTHQLLPATDPDSPTVARLKNEASWLQGSVVLALFLHHQEPDEDRVVGTVAETTAEVVHHVMQNLSQAFPPWSEIRELEQEGQVPDDVRYWRPSSPPDSPWPAHHSRRVTQLLRGQDADRHVDESLHDLVVADLERAIGLFRDAVFDLVNEHDRTRRARRWQLVGSP